MKRYIFITIGNRSIRVEIDQELAKKLKRALKDKYVFDHNGYLKTNFETTEENYKVKQLIFKNLLEQIDTYKLSPELRERINYLKSFVNLKKSTIYSSDVTELDRLFNETTNLYNDIKSNSVKKTAQELDDNLKEEIINSGDDTEENLAIAVKALESATSDNILKSYITEEQIDAALEDIHICSSVEEYNTLTNRQNGEVSLDTYVDSLTNDFNSDKIILPPNASIEEVVSSIVSSKHFKALDNSPIEITGLNSKEQKVYGVTINNLLTDLVTNLTLKGINRRNVNYYGLDFIKKYMSISHNNGGDFEQLLKGYFRGEKNALSSFMRDIVRFNGGDESLRKLMESVLVEQAVNKHLISRDYLKKIQSHDDMQRMLNNIDLGYKTSGGATIKAGSSSSISSTSTINKEIATNFTSEIVNDVPNFEPNINDGTSGLNGIKAKGISPVTPKGSKASGEVAPNVGPKGTNTKKDIKPTQNKGKGVTLGGEATLNATGSINRDLRVGFRKNALFSNAAIEDGEDIDGSVDDDLDPVIPESDGGDGGISRTPEAVSTRDDNYLDDAEEEAENPLVDGANAVKDALKKQGKKELKKGIMAFIKKHPAVLAVGGGILAFLIFVLFIVMVFNDDEMSKMGYYDQVCNFNDTRVTITSCMTNDTLQSLELRDYVIKMTAVYVKNNNYSDETIKALMIILKTNALSLGEYSNSNKNISVRACDVYSNATDTMFDELGEDLSKFGNLYNEVSEYLFISTSYKSSISFLSKASAITLNDTILSNMETEASKGSTYSDILTNVFKTENEENITVDEYKENLFLGDSRMQGMLLTSVISNSNTIYGVGYGYSWLTGSSGYDSSNTNATNGGINGINSKIISGKSYNIIIWLGVNDLYNVNNYLEKYKELASGDWSSHNIYVVSVGPVLDSGTSSVTNDAVNTFNATIKDGIEKANLSNLKYINLGLNENSIGSYDGMGVHYGSADYKNIYNIIISNISSVSGVISNKLALYKLSDYCTYYNLTENDAYWWPIGSKEATSGNIYGGDPISTNITSPFGMRLHPKTNKYKLHTGIDIGSVGDASPVIATKSGKVIFVKEGCTDSTCSCDKGGYGNNVKIDHGNGIVSLYAHLSSVSVNVGDEVQQGEKIGVTGTTGCSTGNHLHFEIQLNGKQVNPIDYVNAENPRPVNLATTNIVGDIKVIGDTGDYSNRAKNKNIVCESLLASGFSQDATIGIMANMETESAHTYDPHVVEYGSGYTYSTVYNAPASKAVGFGIIQWSFGRRIELINYAKEKGWDPASMGAQLNFLYYELAEKSAYSITYKYVTGNYSSREIAVAFCKNYERPKNSVANLKTSDSCTSRADINEPLLSSYVKNNCSE